MTFPSGNGVPCPAPSELRESTTCVPDLPPSCANTAPQQCGPCGVSSRCGITCGEADACSTSADCAVGLLCGSYGTCVSSGANSAVYYVQSSLLFSGLSASMVANNTVVLSDVKLVIASTLTAAGVASMSPSSVCVLKAVPVTLPTACAIQVRGYGCCTSADRFCCDSVVSIPAADSGCNTCPAGCRHQCDVCCEGILAYFCKPSVPSASVSVRCLWLFLCSCCTDGWRVLAGQTLTPSRDPWSRCC